MTAPKIKVRENPRLSVNKLGEYIKAKPLRRFRILQEAKFPPTFITKRYEEACEVMVDYFIEGRDMKPVLQKLEEVYARKHRTPFEQQTDQLTIQALEAFYENADDLTLPDDYTGLSGLHSNLPLATIAGTEISIRPEIFIRHPSSKGPAIGAIKLYLSKTHPLTIEVAAYVGALIRHQLQEFYTKSPKVNPKCCLVYDVFANTLHIAPTAYKTRFKDVEAACLEIAGRWDAITT